MTYDNEPTGVLHDVRIVEAGSAEIAYLQRQERTEAQKAQDQILEKATGHAEIALEEANKTLDWLAVISPQLTSKHRGLPVYVQQLIDDLAELRRVRQ